MKKEQWLIGIIKGKKGVSRENGKGYIIYQDGSFVDETGVPKQINNHNTDLSFLKV